MITVTITDTPENISLESRHRTEDPKVAVERAIAKHWGKRAWFRYNSALAMPDLGVWYGHVVSSQGVTLTPQIRIGIHEKVSEDWRERAGAGSFKVHQAGANAYRVSCGRGDVLYWYSQFNDATTMAGRLHQEHD